MMRSTFRLTGSTIQRSRPHALRIGSGLDPGKHPVVNDDIQNDLAIGRVVAVDGMEDIAGIDRAPDDVARLAFARQQPDARGMR